LQKDGIFSYLFSWGIKTPSEPKKSDDDFILNEEELDSITYTLKQSINEDLESDPSEDHLTQEEKDM
jgi:hypothetical protein